MEQDYRYIRDQEEAGMRPSVSCNIARGIEVAPMPHSMTMLHWHTLACFASDTGRVAIRCHGAGARYLWSEP
jgi:hypothetical protein